MGKETYTAEQVAEALKATGGVVAAAARKLGCDRSTVHRKINKYVTVEEAYKEACETNLDIAEGKLLGLIKAGDFKAIKFYLRTKGKERGYHDKIEHEHTGNAGITVNLITDEDE